MSTAEKQVNLILKAVVKVLTFSECQPYRLTAMTMKLLLMSSALCHTSHTYKAISHGVPVDPVAVSSTDQRPLLILDRRRKSRL